jgi:hypothetical protein
MRIDTQSGLRPFSESGYEILDEDLKTRGEVVIWSVAPVVPRLGDTFLVDSFGETHEVAVYEIATFKGGWSAKCQVQAGL